MIKNILNTMKTTGTIRRPSAIGMIVIVLALMLGHIVPAQAQYDATYNQYMFNEFFVNPAYAGSKEALSISGITRQQWVGIKGSPMTYGLCAHTPLANNKIGLGIGMTHESIGTNQITVGYFDFAYRIQLSRGILALGLQGGVGYHDPRYDRLENVDIQDPVLLNAEKGVIFNTGFGAYYYTDNFYLGFSIPRMLNNDYIKGENERFDISDWTYYLQGGYIYDVSPDFSIMPSAMLKITGGASPQLNVSLMGLAWSTLWLGADYRSDNTFAAIAGIQIAKSLRVMYSYDFSLNSTYRSWLGGSHEISIAYTFDYRNKRVVSPRLF